MYAWSDDTSDWYGAAGYAFGEGGKDAREEAARLGQEARAAATLNHPAIVTIHDFETGFDGYFIAMEYVPGAALDKLLKNEPERVRTNLVPLLHRVAEGIAFAHERHVIHRDLKPGNILVTPDNEVKILDFGIAARPDRSAWKIFR